MLETKEMKFIITTEDGKMIAGYNTLKHAEVDVEDLCSAKKGKKFNLYEMTNSNAVTDTVLQKTYSLKTAYPLPEPEPEPEPETKTEDETKKEEETKTEKDEKKEDEKKE